MKKDIEVQELARYTMTSPDGEVGCSQVIVPRFVYDEMDDEVKVSKAKAVEVSGFEADEDVRMGSVYRDEPIVRSTGFVWIVEQTWRANV